MKDLLKKIHINNKIFKFRKVDFIIIPLIAILLSIAIIYPKIKLIGKDHITISYNENYIEKGAKSSYFGKDLSQYIKKSGKVNTKKIGKYEITYTIDNLIIPITKKRKIEVVDTKKPHITLKGDKNITICPNKEYIDEGYTAKDEYDGDLTDKVKVIKNNDKIIYEVSDSSNNKTKVVRLLKYEDKTSPIINLNGLDEIYLTTNQEYKDPGVIVKDNCDGNIKDKLIITSNVDTKLPGSYTVTYKVKDQEGNETTSTRKVIVQDQVNPNSGTYKPGVIYLTFDDGPQDGTTNVILDILKEENVLATFFVTSRGPDELIIREAEEGHTVALHTSSHDYATVYSSVDAFFNDLNTVHDRVQRLTGLDSRIIRFPGGSSNTVSRRYSKGIMTTLTNEVLNRGYRYYDWNITSGDAGETTDPNEVYQNVINHLSHDRPNMILMHDIKTYTRDALRNIIKFGKENGYTFEKITTQTAMIRQRINN